MIEQFTFEPSGNYPGKATVIFYKNGPSVSFDKQGRASIRPSTSDVTPYYMEAEINSPIVKLVPNESYAWETTWYPIRIDTAPQSVSESGVVSQRLTATRHANSLAISGSFSSFGSGSLVAVFMTRGAELDRRVLRQVRPEESIVLDESLPAPSNTKRVLLKLLDQSVADLGTLDQANIQTQAQPTGSSTK